MAHSEPDSIFAAFWQTMGSVKITALFRFILLGTVALLVYFGRDMVDDAISRNPDVAESKARIAEVKGVATEANGKADQLIATQERIFAAMRSQTEATNAVNLSLRGVSTQVDLLARQMDRMEGRQDGILDHAKMPAP